MTNRFAAVRTLGPACGSALIFTLVSLAAVTSALAADKYAAEFMRIGVGARALGMGGAFVATADDASASYWNPAGLALLDNGELLFMHSEQFDGLAAYDYFGFAQPLHGDTRASVGLGLIRSSVDDIPVTRDAFDDLNGNGERDPGEPILQDQFYSKNDVEYGLLLSYAREFGDRLFLGGNVKLLRQGLLDNTSFGMGIDLGVLYSPRPGLSFGARLADATTTQISWDTGTRETVAQTLAVGTRYTQQLPGLRGSLTAAGDLHRTFDGSDEVSQLGSGFDAQGGLEYWFDEIVAARVGSDAGDFTAGAGLRINGVMDGLGVDYAFLGHEDLGDSHRVSASVRF